MTHLCLACVLIDAIFIWNKQNTTTCHKMCWIILGEWQKKKHSRFLITWCSYNNFEWIFSLKIIRNESLILSRVDGAPFAHTHICTSRIDCFVFSFIFFWQKFMKSWERKDREREKEKKRDVHIVRELHIFIISLIYSPSSEPFGRICSSSSNWNSYFWLHSRFSKMLQS